MLNITGTVIFIH